MAGHPKLPHSQLLASAEDSTRPWKEARGEGGGWETGPALKVSLSQHFLLTLGRTREPKVFTSSVGDQRLGREESRSPAPGPAWAQSVHSNPQHLVLLEHSQLFAPGKVTPMDEMRSLPSTPVKKKSHVHSQAREGGGRAPLTTMPSARCLGPEDDRKSPSAAGADPAGSVPRGQHTCTVSKCLPQVTD